MQLRPYQEKTVQLIREEIKKGNKRILVVLPTGGGKTHVLCDIAQKALNKENKVLALMHRRQLVTQMHDSFYENGVQSSIIMPGFEHALDEQIQLSTMQTYSRRLMLESPEYNPFCIKAAIAMIDECLVSGTLVDGINVENLKIGDCVSSYNEKNKVIEKKKIIKLFKSTPKSLCRVLFKDGRSIICTENHPFYSLGKYLTANNLTHNIMVGCIITQQIDKDGRHENYDGKVQDMWKRSSMHRVGKAISNFIARLRPRMCVLFGRMFGENEKRTLCQVRENDSRKKPKGCFGKNEGKQSNGKQKSRGENESNKKGKWYAKFMPFFPWWEWETFANISTVIISSPWVENRNTYKNGWNSYPKNIELLQDRYRESRNENCNRNRRSFSCWEKKVVGQEERQVLGTLRVESVEIYKQTSDGRFGGMCQDGYVYNIEVEGNNNYFAEGILVHNCHHALNPTYQKILKHYEDKIIIGVTATPILSTGVGMGNYFQSLVSAVTVQELVGDGYLVPGVYYGPSAPDLSRVSTVMGDYHKTELNEVMNQPKLIGDVVYNWLKYAENRKTMVFAVKVSHSKALCEEFNKKGIKAAHLDNHSEDDERNEVLNSFRYGDTSVLCNVALYTEGTDIPEIECIVLARPTKSIGLHLQMIGRGARPNTGKQNFIVLDHGGNIDRLGLYEDEVEWSLDGKGVGYKKKTNRVKEKKLITCDICSHIFTGCQCPACGYSVPDYGKRISSIDADLVEIGKNRKKKKEYSMEEKKRWFAMLLGYARQKGYSEGWASHKYKEKMSVWPNKAKDIKPVSPDEEVLRYIKYQNIKWAKSKQKMEQTGHDQDSRNPRASKRKMGWDICYPWRISAGKRKAKPLSYVRWS